MTIGPGHRDPPVRPTSYRCSAAPCVDRGGAERAEPLAAGVESGAAVRPPDLSSTWASLSVMHRYGRGCASPCNLMRVREHQIQDGLTQFKFPAMAVNLVLNDVPTT